MNTKIRTTIIALVASFSVAGVALTPVALTPVAAQAAEPKTQSELEKEGFKCFKVTVGFTECEKDGKIWYCDATQCRAKVKEVAPPTRTPADAVKVGIATPQAAPPRVPQPSSSLPTALR